MRRYGAWAGNKKGTLENTSRCIAEVAERGRAVFFHQCGRKRGYGEDGLYCKQHAAMIERGIYVDTPADNDPTQGG